MSNPPSCCGGGKWRHQTQTFSTPLGVQQALKTDLIMSGKLPSSPSKLGTSQFSPFPSHKSYLFQQLKFTKSARMAEGAGVKKRNRSQKTASLIGLYGRLSESTTSTNQITKVEPTSAKGGNIDQRKDIHTAEMFREC